MSEPLPPAPPSLAEEPAHPPATTIWRALGEVTAIFASSPAYKFFTLADLEWMVMPALQAGQCRLCHKGPRPVGVVLWAMLDDPTSARMLDPRFRLRPDQWTIGPRIWVTDVVHTGGPDPELTNAMLQDVKALLGHQGEMHVRPMELMASLQAAVARQGHA